MKKSPFQLFGISLFIFFLLSQYNMLGQEKKNFKNVVKYNLTTGILYDHAFQMAYERVINKNQSLNIIGGYNEFPVSLKLNLENSALSNNHSKSGYMIGVDYRFYLKSENKYEAPHGLYLAPFVSIYHFQGDRTLSHTDSTGTVSSANLSTSINFFNIGGELGYQFVLWKRLTIDAVMFGPAYTHYKFHGKLDGSLPGLDDNETINAIIDALIDKFPLLDDLSKDKEVDGHGNKAFWSVGFRYSVSIGFRF